MKLIKILILPVKTKGDLKCYSCPSFRTSRVGRLLMKDKHTASKLSSGVKTQKFNYRLIRLPFFPIKKIT